MPFKRPSYYLLFIHLLFTTIYGFPAISVYFPTDHTMGGGLGTLNPGAYMDQGCPVPLKSFEKGVEKGLKSLKNAFSVL